jgi:hypothetical protein
MKFLLQASLPHEAFNAAVLNGSIGDKMNRIMQAIKPEAVYFTAINGKRHAMMIVNMNDTSEMPSLAEPWFLLFNADITFNAVMTPEDLARGGLDQLGKQWAP